MVGGNDEDNYAPASSFKWQAIYTKDLADSSTNLEYFFDKLNQVDLIGPQTTLGVDVSASVGVGDVFLLALQALPNYQLALPFSLEAWR